MNLRNGLRFFFICLFVFTLIPLSVFAAPKTAYECVEFLLNDFLHLGSNVKKVYVGERMDESYLTDLGHRLNAQTTRFVINRLGVGGYGGDVYRIEEYSKEELMIQSTVLKDYPSLKNANKDTQLMALLSDAYAESLPLAENFKLAHYSKPKHIRFNKIDHYVVTISDTRGRTLDSLLQDQKISTSFKEELKNLYKIRAKKWQTILEKKGYTPDPDVPSDTGVYGMLFRKNKNSSKIESQFALHYEQVVVDLNNLDMVIIDPL